MIYADNAATTRISDYAFEQMLPFLREQYGNASSSYSLGTKAKRAVEKARKQVATAIGATPTEITFTSSGSESNNWVLKNAVKLMSHETIHIITSAIEHPSVLNTCRALERIGVEVTYLPVDRRGRVSFTSVSDAIRPNTRLVSIMLANNEIGTIQPLSEIGPYLREKGILFHTDAVQVVGHIPVDVCALYVDFLTASAHKFNGAKGIGILYKRLELDISPLVYGGQQEQELRAGTENVAGIVAAGYAIEESIKIKDDVTLKLKEIVNTTSSIIQERIPTARVNGDVANRLPGILNISFGNVSGESIMHLLDLKGICISTSSACASSKDEPSHVLLALGLTEVQAKSSVRISYGRYNTMEDASAIASAVCDVYAKIKANQ